MSSGPLRSRYRLVTFGCQMNEYDSGLVAEMLESAGAVPVDSPDEADLIVVNTCSVRAKADETVFRTISNYACLKKRNPLLRIAVIGCMAQAHGEAIRERAPYVDFVFGPDRYLLLPQLLDERADGLEPVQTAFDRMENYRGLDARQATPFSAMVAVQRGCNHRCSYCIVPYTRGPEKYRAAGDVLRECRRAAERGAVEVLLLGQTVNGWREGEKRFPGLLRAICGIDGLRRIRFTSPHPIHFGDDLVETMASEPKICKHVHLPMQSGSTRVLREMRRTYTRERYLDTVRRLREAMPEIAITADIIAGFPTETEEEFRETLSAMEEIRFDGAFMFAYSERPGTDAATMAGAVPEEVRQERLLRMIDLQNAITREKTEAQLGKTEELLLERPSRRDPDRTLGRTDGFRKVLVPNGLGKPGDFVRAKLTGISGWTLLGERADA